VLHNPAHAAAWHLLGVLHSMTGNQSQCARRARKAVRSNPHDIGAAFNYAMLSQLGEHKGRDHFRRCSPASPTIFRRGSVSRIRSRARPQTRRSRIRRVLAADAGNCRPRSALRPAAGMPCPSGGRVLVRRALPPQCRAHLAADPAAEAHRQARARRAGRTRTTPARPDDAGCSRCSAASCAISAAPRAIAFCGESIRLKPNTVDGHLNLAAALFDVGEFDGAIVCYRKVLELDPKSAEAQAWLGSVLQVTGRIGPAIRALRKAIAMQPDMPLAHFNLALALLSVGRYPEGWAEYEWRWRTDAFQRERRDFRAPAWDGGDLAGKRLLVWTEQGSATVSVRALFAAAGRARRRVASRSSPGSNASCSRSPASTNGSCAASACRNSIVICR
jgi:tetratricopeptide (TPR) repeat protein